MCHIFYLLSLEWASTVFYLNPLTGVVQGFRWPMFGGEAPGPLLFVSFGMIIILFITGLIYFNKVEGEMADYIKKSQPSQVSF
ncbi:MAG: hypothetical protein ACQERC_01925 [Bacteroidota bacterium]